MTVSEPPPAIDPARYEALLKRFGSEWKQAMAEAIKRLLVTQPACKRRWVRELQRPAQEEEPSISAVARVLAKHRHVGDGPLTDGEFQSAKTLVNKVFKGKQITRATLDLFIEAFLLDDTEGYEDLMELWDRRAIPAVRGELAEALLTLAEATPEITRARISQRTISLFEKHTIGCDRTPVAHHTHQVIRALATGPDRHIYIHDAPDAVVTIESGGTPGRPLRLTKNLVGQEILYGEKLRAGDQRILVYETKLRYPEPVEPLFRRAVIRRVSAMSILVRFHPEALPARIFWCWWPASMEEPVEREEHVSLDANHSVSRFVDTAWDKGYGFRWEWD